MRLLRPGERVEHSLSSLDARLRATDRRLIVTAGLWVPLDIAYADIRRIEFDLEAGRPGVLVVVPFDVKDPPQMLSIGRDRLHKAAEVLAFIGDRLT